MIDRRNSSSAAHESFSHEYSGAAHSINTHIRGRSLRCAGEQSTEPYTQQNRTCRPYVCACVCACVCTNITSGPDPSNSLFRANKSIRAQLRRARERLQAHARMQCGWVGGDVVGLPHHHQHPFSRPLSLSAVYVGVWANKNLDQHQFEAMHVFTSQCADRHIPTRTYRLYWSPHCVLLYGRPTSNTLTHTHTYAHADTLVDQTPHITRITTSPGRTSANSNANKSDKLKIEALSRTGVCVCISASACVLAFVWAAHRQFSTVCAEPRVRARQQKKHTLPRHEAKQNCFSVCISTYSCTRFLVGSLLSDRNCYRAPPACVEGFVVNLSQFYGRDSGLVRVPR